MNIMPQFNPSGVMVPPINPGLSLGMALGDDTVITPTPVARSSQEPSISGAQIFITLLLTLLGGAVGYAAGYERAASHVIKRPRASSGNYNY